MPHSKPRIPFVNLRLGLVAAIMCGLGVGSYWNSLHVPFIFDDSAAILENETIRDLSDLRTVLTPPSGGSGVSGRPLINLSLALNYAVSGTSATGYHVTNLLIHLAASVALFGCVRRTLLLPRLANQWRPFASPAALAASSLWLLHPLQTESVTCIVQRTELIVGFFYLITLYCFIRSTSDGSKLWTCAAIASCGLGMASKEVMVSAPLVVLLYDRTFLASSFAEIWRARRGLYLGLACGWIILGSLVLGMGGTRGTAAGFGIGITWWSYALKQSQAIVQYLHLTLWPHPLVVFYGTDVITDPMAVWPQILFLVALVIATIRAVWQYSPWGFLGAWFWAILAPSSSVVPLASQTMSEHRMYLPLVAPVLLSVVALFRCFGHRAVWWALAIAAAFCVTSIRRNADYRSELAIWNDTVAKAPLNARARINLGAALKAAGSTEAARTQFQKALELEPNNPEAFNNIATLFIESDRPAEAIAPCRAALQLNPKLAVAHNNLGSALVQTGQLAEGIAHLEQAIALRPTLAEAHINLASALVAAGNPGKALLHGREAVRLKPNVALAHFNLANTYLAQNRREQAIAEFEITVQLKPDFAEAHSNLGGLYYQAGDPRRALPHFEAAIRIRPGFLDARNNLGSAYALLGRTAEAIAQYRAAIQIDPQFAEAYLNLGLVLANTGNTREALAALEHALRLRPQDPQIQGHLSRLKATIVSP